MTRGAQTCDGLFIEVGWVFHRIPIGSRVFLPPGCSSQFLGVLGIEVDDAQDNSLRGSFTKRL
jgi:hypothetical protein